MREWYWNTSKRDQTTAEQQPGEERAPREPFSCRLLRVQRRAQSWHSDIAYVFRKLENQLITFCSLRRRLHYPDVALKVGDREVHATMADAPLGAVRRTVGVIEMRELRRRSEERRVGKEWRAR